jgi:type I restriction enzyme S subunit
MQGLDLLLPPLREQDEILKVIKSVDDRITLLRETNATLESVAQALFKSWFVDFDPVRAKMEGRAPEGMNEATAALFPDGFEESELGLVPMGWATRTMADVSIVGIGKTPPRKEQHWFSESPNDMRWVSIRDMGATGVYAARTSEFLTREAVEKFNVRCVPDNTVLMSFKMTIGRVAITDGEMTTNEAIAHFKLILDGPLTTEYIYLHLKQFDFSTLSSTSSIADAVNSKGVREIPILVPTPNVIAVFQEKIGAVFAKLKNAEQEIQTLTNLRDTLLPRLISGQLRLPESVALLAEV